MTVYLSNKEILNIKHHIGADTFNFHFEAIGDTAYGRSGFDVTALHGVIEVTQEYTYVKGLGKFYDLDEAYE